MNLLICRTKGFSLIEIAVVLFIVSMLLGGLLTPLSQRIEQANRAATENTLDDLEEALYGFAVINGRLPCPDCMTNGIGGCAAVAAANINDGVEDRTGAAGSQTCAATVAVGPDPAFPRNVAAGDPANYNVSTGNVPWVTLGVGQSDDWGNPFTYSVTTEAADDIALPTMSPTETTMTTLCATLPVQSTIALCTTGNIHIVDNGMACAGARNNVAGDIMAVVVSHGANATRTGAGLVAAPVAANCSELENHYLDNDGIYVSTTYSDPDSATAASYDDLMFWISPNILKNKMISAGRLP